MSEDERQHLMDYLLQQQSGFHSEMKDSKSRVDKTAEKVENLVVTIQRQAAAAEVDRQKMRKAIDNLIVANEATRNLANKIAQLALEESRRFAARDRDHK